MGIPTFLIYCNGELMTSTIDPIGERGYIYAGLTVIKQYETRCCRRLYLTTRMGSALSAEPLVLQSCDHPLCLCSPTATALCRSGNLLMLPRMITDPVVPTVPCVGIGAALE
jgi:hypothetical protein